MDGGTGNNDKLVLPFRESLFSPPAADGDGWNITYNSPVDGLPDGLPEAVGTLYRVEIIQIPQTPKIVSTTDS